MSVKLNHLVSFADSRLQKALDRLRMQAEQFEIFDTMHLFNEKDLSENFKSRMKGRLVAGSRGFGYWTWKPEVISLALEAMDPDECLLYVDAGCHLNVNGRLRMLDYFDAVSKSPNGVIAFQANPPNEQNSKLVHDGRFLFNQPNYQWIKGDAFEYFGVKGNVRATHVQAIGAGVILLRNCSSARAIINEWRELAITRFDLFDDSPSKSPNLDGFVEHRHDQAVWTLLCMKHNVNTLSAYEYWYPRQQGRRMNPDWEALHAFPVLAKRDISLGFFDAISLSMSRLSRYTRKAN